MRSARAGYGSSVCVSTLLLSGALAGHAVAACDPDGVQASGAIYRICMPDPGNWNGNLIIWAHGYVAFNKPVAIPEDQLQLPDGTSLPGLVNALGYAFATTSYSVNGLAVRQGVADVVDLVDVFALAKGPAGRVYLVGASEGGLVTALGIERRPDVFTGGLAACGPIGSFLGQTAYLGDFRVVFDYFYPGLVPGDANQVPQALIDNWDAYYASIVKPVIFSPLNLARTLELVRVTKVPFDIADFWNTVERSIRDGLFYAVFATNDAIEKLGGQPFDNVSRVYAGSSSDPLLNLTVQRVQADPGAIAEVTAHYDTTGVLARPLVTLHTLLDQQVPIGHEVLYFLKAKDKGSLGELAVIPVNRYGHCNFMASEVLVSFAVLVLKAEGLPLTGVNAILKDTAERSRYDDLARKQGLPPLLN